ncbi:aspartyl/asparaginyl beta-hydroxylase isoform X2 [Thamnophis elegans]|uniref:aspartyl/asparaginyl beta-hydroxylase isoform X2 n=1 Tax=Thamnophis elegans TaxID=35005 RepID=UPI0013786592|nr:aspartyl/asparaginyl beta-hydroxylase isoform X2 [Thamnophis elegans]
MAPRRNPKSGSPGPGARREAKHGGNKSAKKEGVSGSSFFTWFMVIALLGVWTSVAVVWFELVDYEEVLGKLGIYDADGDGDFDMEDAKVLLGLKERSVPEQSIPRSAEEVIQPAEKPHVKTEHVHIKTEPEDEIEALLHEVLDSQLEKGEIDVEKVEIEKDEVDEDHEETDFQEEEEKEDSNEVSEEPTTEETYDKEIEDKIPETSEKSSSTQEEPASHYQPKDQEEYDTDVLNDYSPVEEDTNEPEIPESGPGNAEQPDHIEEEELEREDFNENTETIDRPEQIHERDADVSDSVTEPVQSVHKEVHKEDHVAAQQHDTEVPVHAEDYTEDDVIGDGEKDTLQKEKVKKKKPKLLNKFDRSIKVELDAAEKLRKKGKTEEALRAFEALVSKYPQSPRARYGKAQSEDDFAEKMRSNEILQRSITTYGEVANLPNVPDVLVKMTLKRRADRQQFLGRMRGSLVTLQKLVDLFPNDTSFKNNLGVGYLLIGDNNNAKKIYQEVLSLAPNDGFAKVHYGFILKSENKIEESIPYLKEGLESGDPGTDDGRFYFHLGDAMQRVGNKEAYKWYELGYQRGHFASVWQRSLYNVKGLKAQPWWTAKETGYTELIKSLEKNWKVIRDEGLSVMDRSKGLFLPEDENLREKGDWSQFTLWQQGRKNENACNSVPKSCALLERFTEATGCRRGQIKYSVMHPGTHVWPHTGPTNCRLRMHLGLVIPKEGCRIRCAEETRFWEEGKILIFDDSFEHEVWQDANAYRLIFIVDVWHPELTSQQRRTLPAI